MQRLDAKLEALATMSPAQLRTSWFDAYTGPLPRLAPALLRLAIAHCWQAKKQGGLPISIIRELQRIAAGEQSAAAAPATASLRPGTQLVREWQGQLIRVEVVEGGFIWEGEHHASLSSIAKAVTGAHWSGPRFFGVAPRGK